MSGCVFCRIIAGQVPADIVYEDERVLAFLDINPAASGHTLVIPKAHTNKVESLTPEDAEALFRMLHRLIRPIREAVGCQATTIGINDGPGSGQEVPHVHIHIIPRYTGDGGSIIQATVHTSRPTHQQFKETAEKIRNAIELSHL